MHEFKNLQSEVKFFCFKIFPVPWPMRYGSISIVAFHTLINPVFLSSSYLTLLPFVISTTCTVEQEIQQANNYISVIKFEENKEKLKRYIGLAE